MKAILTFRKMISPSIIQFLFWLTVIACIYTAITDIIAHERFIVILQILILGPLAARIISEFLLLFFRISEQIDEIKKILNAPKADS